MTTHRYLFDEHPHFFYPTLATRIGLNEAIVLQQVHSWIQTYTRDPNRYREKHYHDGAWWTWDSYPEWAAKLPYLSESTIRRALLNLRELEIIKVGNYNTLKIDRTYWYTIDYGEYDALWASDHYTKRDRPSVQNDQMEDTILDRPLPSLSSPDSSPDLEEPAAPDSPPADEPFYKEGETPTAPAVPRTAEEHKAGVKRAIETFHRTGGNAGVADPSQDDGWLPAAREFSALIITPNVPESTLRLWAGDIQAIVADSETGKGPEEVCAAIRSIAMCEHYEWLRSCNRPTHKGFVNALLAVLWGQELPDRGKRNGASTPRQEENQRVIQAAMDELFDPETGKKRKLM